MRKYMTKMTGKTGRNGQSMENINSTTLIRRNAVVSYTIMPDYPDAYAWENELDNHSLGKCVADGGTPGEWYGKIKISKSLSRRFDQWQSEFRVIANAEMDNSEPQDWRYFHREGVALARLLKAEMGSKARVFYEKPSEDRGSYIDERIEILNGGDIVVYRRVGQKGRNFLPVDEPNT